MYIHACIKYYKNRIPEIIRHVHSIINILNNTVSPVQEVNASGEISNFFMSCVKQLDTGQVHTAQPARKKEGEKNERKGRRFQLTAHSQGG